ncbi:hypothetical protein BH23CHL7_BH23CHL7_17190 [soil metagenome]
MAKTATTEMRRCIGSKTFGIEPHEAPVADFPAQPSQKDGLGRMCKPHWRQYTNALRKAAVARKTADAGKAADAGSAREVKRAKTPTKRERRRAPMAHLPTTTEEVEQTIREVLAE